MTRFEVYATTFDSPRVIAHLIPARGLSFSFPLSAHGEASFTATAEPGRSFWRSSLGGPRSGILIAEAQDDGPPIPIWGGRLRTDVQQNEREFSITCSEWGSAMSWFPAPVDRWVNTHDTDIYLDIVAQVQAVSGQNIAVQTTGIAQGPTVSTFEVKAEDRKTADEALQELTNAAGAPEFAYVVGGTFKNPIRQLMLGTPLGNQQARKVLEYVEDTADPTMPGGTPSVVLLSDLYPGSAPMLIPGRRGGNVIAVRRTQDADSAATVAVAVNGQAEGAQKRATRTSPSLLAAGWPRITRSESYDNVVDQATLQRHADADLAASAGIATEYSLVTLGRRPNWREVSRGDMVRVKLDTDVYAGRRPLVFESRLRNLTVTVPDDGGDEQVQWDIATVLEV